MDDKFKFIETLIETIPSPIFYKDNNGIYTGCNKAFEEYLGRSRQDIIGKTVYDMAPKEIADKYFEKDNELFNSPGKQIYNWKVQDKSGNIKHVVFHKATFTDSNGCIAGLIGVILDITELVKTGKALEESRQRLFDIINFLPEATFVVDNNGIVIIWNKAIEDMTGVKAEEIIGKGNHEYAVPFYGEGRPVLLDLIGMSETELMKKYPLVKKEKDAIFAEVFLPDFNGKKAYLLGKAATLYNSRGEVVGAIETIRDITEIRLAAQKLEDAYNELSSMQDKLLQSQKMSAVGQLAGVRPVCTETMLNVA